MNPLIKILITSDWFLLSGLGMVTPIFAIYIKEGLAGGSIAAAGVAQTIFYIVKAVIQMPVARFVDREPANLREFWTLLIGTLLLLPIPMFYLYIHTVHQLYAVQLLLGVASGIAYPGWMAIFTKAADHDHAAASWSFYSTAVIFGLAGTAAIGGWVAEHWGFRILFLLVEAFVLIGTVSMLALALFYEQLKTTDPARELLPFRQRLWNVVRHRHGAPSGVKKDSIPK